MLADRSGMAASRFLVAAAACVKLLRFAAENGTSQSNIPSTSRGSKGPDLKGSRHGV